MEPKEWGKKLDAFKKVSKWSQAALAEKVGLSDSQLSEGRGKRPILPKHYDTIATAMGISEEDFVSDFERFQTALLNKWKPAWKRLLRESCPDTLGANTIKFAPTKTGMRLVAIDEHPGPSDSFEIRKGQLYRIQLDLMDLFEKSDIELENDADPLEGVYLYVFQVEGDDCLLLRPNSTLNPKGFPDWHDSTENDDLGWTVVIPPRKCRPEGMRFVEAGPGELFVLIWKRPMSKSLQEELSNPRGARISSLDKLANELVADGGVHGESRNFWRLFRQAYVVKR